MLSKVMLQAAELDEIGGTVLDYVVKRQVGDVIVSADLRAILPCYEGHPVRATVDVGAAQGATLDEAVARLSRWLRATADALEARGAVSVVPLSWTAGDGKDE